VQNDLFSEVFDGAIDQFIDPSETTLEEQELDNEEDVNPSLRSDVDNLLSNGSISSEVSLAGHVFVIRTLTIGEELAVSLVCDDYKGNVSQPKAIASATVAAALESIDGRALMHRISPDPVVNIRHKFGYIRNKWYWSIIQELYQHYLLLVDRQIYAFQDLRGK